MYELQAVDELDFFGCVEVKVPEGGISRGSEALEVFYGLHEPGGGETHRKEGVLPIRSSEV